MISKPQHKPLRHETDRVTLSPLAFLKLQFFLHAGDTEVGGFGVCREDDLLYVEDFRTVKQVTSAMTVEFDDQSVAEYFEDRVDEGLEPRQFARIWIHTHPGESAEPSSVDERTFSRVFGSCDWACMFIMGRTGKTYARLRFSAGPSGCLLLPVVIDWASWPQTMEEREGSMNELMASWMGEYGSNIHPQESLGVTLPKASSRHTFDRFLLDDRELVEVYEELWLNEQMIDAACEEVMLLD